MFKKMAIRLNDIYIPPLVSIWFMLCAVGWILLATPVPILGIIMIALSKLSLIGQLLLWMKED